MTKKFQVQIKCGSDTRFPVDDCELARWIAILLQTKIPGWCAGKIPAVSAIPEEQSDSLAALDARAVEIAHHYSQGTR